MSDPIAPPAPARAVLDFWFGPEAGPERWFKKDPTFDAAIRARFADACADALAGGLADWRAGARGCLALILLLDQFPRNLHRDDARAFAGDARARAVLARARAAGFDRELDPAERHFLYMPLMHSEDPADQRDSVALFEALGNADVLKYARAHKAIIDRFGRYPHRNAVLGRASTPEEEAFLRQPGSSF